MILRTPVLLHICSRTSLFRNQMLHNSKIIALSILQATTRIFEKIVA